jgi:hypothetical protein
MSDIERIILLLTPLISLLSILVGWLRWKGGEKAVSDSSAVENFSKAANTTAELNQRLQERIEEQNQEKVAMQEKMEKDHHTLQEQLSEGAKLISDLRIEREQWIKEREVWQDRNIELAKRVGVLSKNYEGVEKELERIRRWGYANSAEVMRLGGTPIRLEDVR